jgi:hemin uptake protein HemP
MSVSKKPKTEGAETPALPKIDASTLLVSGREVILVHKDTEYRLRLTSNDKLILTK